MKTITKRILIASAGLMAGGVIIGGIGFFMGGRAGVNINSYGIHASSGKSEAVKLDKTKLDAFSEADFMIDAYADINIKTSEDNNYYLEYRLDKSCGKPEYEVSEGILTMKQKSSPGGVINLGFSTDTFLSNTHINLYVPEGSTLDYLKVYNDSGDLSLDGLTLKDADLEIDYGNAELNDLMSDSISLTLDSGYLELTDSEIGAFTLTDNYGGVNVKSLVSDSASFTLESGNLNLADSEIGIFTLNNEYGKNTLKNFKCGTANLDLDSSDLYMDAAELASLNCETEYGDITLLLPEKLETYTFDLSTDYGYIRLPSDAPRGYYSDRDDEEEYYQTDGKGKNFVTIHSDSGDIEMKER